MSPADQKALPKWLQIIKVIMQIILEVLNNLPDPEDPQRECLYNECLENLEALARDFKHELDQQRPKHSP